MYVHINWLFLLIFSLIEKGGGGGGGAVNTLTFYFKTYRVVSTQPLYIDIHNNLTSYKVIRTAHHIRPVWREFPHINFVAQLVHMVNHFDVTVAKKIAIAAGYLSKSNHINIPELTFHRDFWGPRMQTER